MSLDGEDPAHPKPAQPKPASDASMKKPVRTITDAQTMRALAHPVRIAIIEALGLGGPMTATEVGEQIDESPTTCSFHLRQLAKYGIVEEAGGGKGRARPWRLIALGFSIPSTHDDPEADVAANMLTRMNRERQLGRFTTWMDTRSSYPREWRDAAVDSQYGFYLTAEELEQLDDELQELLGRWFGNGERMTDPSRRPPGAVPVELLLFGYPLELPKPGSAGQPSTGESSTGDINDAEDESR